VGSLKSGAILKENVMSKVADILLLPPTEPPLFTLLDEYGCEHLNVSMEEADGEEYFFCQDCGDEVDMPSV
jgi:hypothetical protein